MSKNTKINYRAVSAISVDNTRIYLRDYFAGLAMQGLLAGGHHGRSAEVITYTAYQIAELMLAEREKGDE